MNATTLTTTAHTTSQHRSTTMTLTAAAAIHFANGSCDHAWVQVFDPNGPRYYQQCAYCGAIG